MPDHLEFPQTPGLAPAPGYSHVATGGGRVVATAGQVALDQAGAMVGEGDVRAQAQQVFDNLRLALAAADATFDHVIKLNYYLLDVRDLPAIREIRDRFVSREHPPASTVVQVAALFRPGFLIEVEAWAVVP